MRPMHTHRGSGHHERYGKSGRTEVADKLRREVHKIEKGYVDQGVAEVVPSVVFIDEVSICSPSTIRDSNVMEIQVHMLDIVLYLP